MLTVSKLPLSAGTNGGSLLVAATSTIGTTVHSVSTTVTDTDEIWIWAVNNHTADVVLTVEWTVATAAKNIETTIPFNDGLYQVIPGLIVVGAAGPLLITAFAGTTNIITLFGYVNRLSTA